MSVVGEHTVNRHSSLTLENHHRTQKVAPRSFVFERKIIRNMVLFGMGLRLSGEQLAKSPPRESSRTVPRTQPSHLETPRSIVATDPLHCSNRASDGL